MKKLKTVDLKEFLDEKYEQYNRFDFISTDPISIPHLFSKKEDIEIAGFLAATIAWGQRVTIINNATKLMKLMDNDPHNFVMNAREKELNCLHNFKHRTFNSVDAVFFFKALQHIYRNYGGLQQAFLLGNQPDDDFSLLKSITHFRSLFFSIPFPDRTGKHVSNPAQNSSSKRLCMYIRVI